MVAFLFTEKFCYLFKAKMRISQLVAIILLHCKLLHSFKEVEQCKNVESGLCKYPEFCRLEYRSWTMDCCCKIKILEFVSDQSGNKITCGIINNQDNPFLKDNTVSGILVPWSASIKAQNSQIDPTVKTGKLVSPSLIMTSTDNFSDRTSYAIRIDRFSKYIAFVGGSRFPITSDHVETGVRTEITHITIHPKLVIGHWTETLYNQVLIHLSQEIKTNNLIQPICLPQSASAYELLLANEFSSEIVLPGWNRNSNDNTFLRLEIQDESSPLCTKHQIAMQNKFCAVVNERNKHDNCIPRDNGPIKNWNGTYFLVGQHANYFSNKSKCYHGNAYFFHKFPQITLDWISNNAKCGPFNFTCGTGKCIPLEKYCDWFPDCEDETDENETICRNQYKCKKHEFYCKDSLGSNCILLDKLNNGVADCPNGEDEMLPRSKLVPTVIAILIIVIISTCILISFSRRRRQKNRPTSASSSMVVNYNSTRYPKLDYLGGGGFGKVWRTQDNGDLKRPYYALKIVDVGHMLRGHPDVPRETLLADASSRWPLVMREVENLTLLNDPNVIRYFGCWGTKQGSEIDRGELNQIIRNEESRLFAETPLSNVTVPSNYLQLMLHIRMELCGDSLDHWLTNDICEGNDDQTINIAKQIASGLEYIHSFPIIHRDIKPDNILFHAETRKWKINDFGLAIMHDASAVQIRPAGAVWYQSPEMYAEIGYTEITDVWSLGLVFLQMVMRRKLDFPLIEKFEQIRLGDDRDTLINKVTNGRCPNLVGIIKQMLTNEDQRCNSSEILQYLQ